MVRCNGNKQQANVFIKISGQALDHDKKDPTVERKMKALTRSKIKNGSSSYSSSINSKMLFARILMLLSAILICRTCTMLLQQQWDQAFFYSLYPGNFDLSYTNSSQEINSNLYIKSSDYEYMYQSALNTLGCFITPQCYPRYKCRTGHPQKLARQKRWEEIAFCTDDLKRREKSNDRCLVYSFGIYNSIEWETKVAKLFDCEVHAFDPTVNHTNTSLVTFHKLGLQGEGSNVSLTNGVEYNAKDPNLLLSLPEIMERLGHTGRKLSVLMMDCEGCEWGVLKQIVCDQGASSLVDQLVIEMHFQRSLGLATEADVLLAANVITCMRMDGWGLVAQSSSGCHNSDANYTRGVLEILYGEMFIMYAALRRVPPGEGVTLSDVFDLNSPMVNKTRNTWRDDWGKIVRKTHIRRKSKRPDPFETYPQYKEPEIQK